MTESHLKDQANASLELHEWQYKSGRYSHSSGIQLMPSPLVRSSDTAILSPSSIRMVSGCKRRFFLSRNPHSPLTRFQSAEGQSVREPQLDNARALDGRIIHETVRLLVNVMLRDPILHAGLGWRTTLTPIIHYAITAEMEKVERSTPNSPVFANARLTMPDITDVIDRIASEILAKKLGGFTFDRKNWIELSSLNLHAEQPLERDEFAGYADLMSLREDILTIVDLKTGRVPDASEKTRYSDEDTSRVISDPLHPLNPEATQLACYAWMASDNGNDSRTIVVHTDETPLSTVEFLVGITTIQLISEMIRDRVVEAKRILQSSSAPSGHYSPHICGHCSYRMNCPELLQASTTTDLDRAVASQRRGTIPLLLRVLEIDPDSSTVELALAQSSLNVKIPAYSKNYLRHVNTVLRSGVGLLGFVKISVGSDSPFSETIEFSRC